MKQTADQIIANLIEQLRLADQIIADEYPKSQHADYGSLERYNAIRAAVEYLNEVMK